MGLYQVLRRSVAFRAQPCLRVSAALLACLVFPGLVSAQILLSITVSPPNPSFALGTTQQMTATGTFSDGSTQDLTDLAAWSTLDPTIATVNNSGLVMSVAVGQTVVSATAAGITGFTNLSVTPATLVSIAVTPAMPSVALGLQQQFTATGTFTDSTTQDITKTAQWSSSAPAVASIANDPAHVGLATTAATGMTTITATSGVITGVMLAFARVAGETAPLLFTALGNDFWSLRLNQPSAALPLQIYRYALSPYDDFHRQAWAGALVLIILIVTSVAAVRYVVRRGTFGAA